MIKDFKENTEIVENLFITNVVRGVTNKNVPYLNITFQDSSGQIEGRKWTVVDEDADIFVKRTIVQVTGQVIKYSNSLQIKVMSGKKLDLSEEEIYNFAPASPVERRLLQKELLRFLAEIDNEDVKKVVEYAISKNEPYFWTFPAATKNHHEYISGLLEHTIGMLKCAEGIIKVYPKLNKSLLYGGIILHDMGKIPELGDALAPYYTVAGHLIGHISIMQAEIAEICRFLKVDEEVSLLLQHLVLSQHGFKEYGSPVVPLTREAEVLAALDNLDAKMNMIDKALNDVPPGEFSGRSPGLDNRLFYQPKLSKKELD